MKTVTNIEQLKRTDLGTLVEVLRRKGIGGGVFQRGVYLGNKDGYINLAIPLGRGKTDGLSIAYDLETGYLVDSSRSELRYLGDVEKYSFLLKGVRAERVVHISFRGVKR